jgi:hypothetical protein
MKRSKTTNTLQTAGEAWVGPKHNRTGQQRVSVQRGALKRLEGPRTQLSLQENVHEGRSLSRQKCERKDLMFAHATESATRPLLSLL